MSLPALAVRSLPVLLVLAAALPALALIGPVPGTTGVVAAQALFLAAWAQLPVPSARRGTVLAALSAASADVVLLRGAPGLHLESLAPVLGIAVVAVFAVQLARRDGRAHVTVAAAAAMSGVLLAVAGSCWLVALMVRPEPRLLIVAGASAVLGGAVACLPWLPLLGRCLAGAALAAAAAWVTSPLDGVAAAVLAAAVALSTTAALSLIAEGYLAPAPDALPEGPVEEGSSGIAGDRRMSIAGDRRMSIAGDRRMTIATVVMGGTVPMLLAGPLLAASIAALGG